MDRLPASSKKGSNLHRNIIWYDIKLYFEIYYSNERNLKWIREHKDLIKQMKPNDRNKLFNFIIN